MTTRLSSLQKYLLKKCLEEKGETPREKFKNYFENKKIKNQEKVLTQSLEALIKRDLLRGFGRRTPEKWFLIKVSLTSLGRLTAKKLVKKKQLELIK